MRKATSFVFGFLFALLGAVVGGQVTKFPAAAGGASYDQSLNTTDNVTHADVTLTDDLILGATSVIQTPTVTGATTADAITIEVGSAGDQQGGILNLFAGASTTAGGGTVLIIAGSSAGDGGGGTAALRAGNNGAATGGDVSAGGAGVGGASGNFQLSAGQSAGTDIAGSQSDILGGGSTGSGVGGPVTVMVTPPGASSDTPNVHAEVFRVDHLGAMFSKVYTAAPAAGDCNDAAETGRFALDSTNDFIYFCSGASGWRKIATTVP